MDVETPSHAKAAPPEPLAKQGISSALRSTILLFVMIWSLLYGLFRSLPYLRNGSDVVFSAKLKFESTGQVFPANHEVTRVLIFGNSKILAGFLPAWFDQLSAQDGRNVSSFNSGFPGSDLLLPPLRTMCQRGQAPNVLLLTLPWAPDPPPGGLFHFVPDDHAVIEALFPFRNFVRDLTAFLLNARSRGGILEYYRESEENERAVIAERGYHLITEQSRFEAGRLPDDFHLDSDLPARIQARNTPSANTQSSQLRTLLAQYHITCYYVPSYLRQGEAAPALPYNQRFAAQVEQATSCRLLGPDYYLYPNRLFADQTHLNEEGARVYTQALFALWRATRLALQ